VKNWDEKPYHESEGEFKLTRASVRKAFHGDLEGERTLEYLMAYPAKRTTSFVGLERFVGRLGDRSGRFTDDGHASTGRWHVAPGWLLDGRPRRLARQLVSDGQVVQRGHRDPFADPLARQAERLLLSTVVGALRDNPAIGLWNLGNEPDLYAWPPSAAAGRAWVREMTQLIQALGPRHPVTCRLHMANLPQDNGLRVTEVFAETDVTVVHAYPMVGMLARSPLDPDFVPLTSALTAALCGKPVLMEEFGGCTVPPGRGSYMWR
jgi:hypothetical protein